MCVLISWVDSSLVFYNMFYLRWQYEYNLKVVINYNKNRT